MLRPTHQPNYVYTLLVVTHSSSRYIHYHLMQAYALKRICIHIHFSERKMNLQTEEVEKLFPTHEAEDRHCLRLRSARHPVIEIKKKVY